MEFISIGNPNLIPIFISYFQHQINDGSPIVDDWIKVTNEKFNEFRITGYNDSRILRMDGIVDTRPTSTTLSYKPDSSVDNFKISIKRDPNLFPSFKDQAIWDNWNHNAIVNACTQDIENILHEAYVSPTPDNMSLLK